MKGEFGTCDPVSDLWLFGKIENENVTGKIRGETRET